MKNQKRTIAALLLAVCVVIILWMTLFGRTAKPGYYGVYLPFHSVSTIRENLKRFGIRSNFLGNILLFIPIGILFPIATGKMKWYWTIGMGVSFSLLIEIIQLITSLGYFDPDDIMLNTLGTAIGFGLWRFGHRKWIEAVDDKYNDI